VAYPTHCAWRCFHLNLNHHTFLKPSTYDLSAYPAHARQRNLPMKPERVSTPGNGATLRALVAALEAVADRTGRVVSWLSFLMVLVTFLVVVLRYAFDLGWIAMQESVTYMHAALFMLGAAYTLRRNGHVRVDIFYQKLSRRGRAWVDLLGTLLLLIPVGIFIAWIGWDYVFKSWAFMEGSREAGGIPAVYLLKTLMIVMPALVLIQGLAWILRTGLFLAGVPGIFPPDEDDRSA